jgi:zinc transporter ZupT
VTEREGTSTGDSARKQQLLVYAIAPAIALGLLLLAIVRLDPLASIREGFPPVEDLTFERVVLHADPRSFDVTVVNGGAGSITIAQVLVDEAYWSFEIRPATRIDPLASAHVLIDYPWVHSEPHEITIVTSTGLTFSHVVEVAVATPTPGASTFLNLTLLGLLVGVIPVLIGLLWAPLVRRLSPARLAVALAFTAGVLAFLVVDAVSEAFGLIDVVPSALGGTSLFVLAIAVAIAALTFIATWLRGRRAGDAAGGVPVALLIAFGIGLHNFGEGLAIAAAYSLGLVAFTSLLVGGFALHNASEGIAIVAPLGDASRDSRRLLWLGLIAGAPTIVGAWLGALGYSPTLSLVFLGLGVGAILQVIWELSRLLRRREAEPVAGLAGAIAGFTVMYVTGILVAI